jgi:hypothetical protein
LLAQSGRLAFNTIHQKCGRSHIHTRNALVGLLKEQIILHSTDDNGVTFYEPNWEVAYILTIRSGSLIRYVEERYDERAAEVFHTILQSGVVRVADLRKAHVIEATKYDSPLSQRSTGDGDAHTNGVDDSLGHWKPGSVAADKDLYATLQLLLQAGLVEVIGVREFMSENDLQQEAMDHVLESYGEVPSGKKALKGFKAEVESTRRRWRDEAHRAFYDTDRNIKKRGRDSYDDDDDDMHETKRQKINHKTPNGAHSRLCSWYQQHEDPLSVSLTCAQLCVSGRACAKQLTEGRATAPCEF